MSGETEETTTEVEQDELPAGMTYGETEETPAEDETEATDPDEGYDFGGGVKFKTQKEALAYQQELLRAKDLELAAANAYRQAAQDLGQQHSNPNIPQAQPEEDIETELYTDPKKLFEKIEQRALTKMEAKLSAKEEDERIWRKFSDKHPDLADFRADLMGVVQENAEIVQGINKTRGQEAAMDWAAQKMRAKFERYNEMKKPKVELGKQKSVTPPAGQTTVTTKKGEEKPLSMVDQLAMLNSKRKK